MEISLSDWGSLAEVVGAVAVTIPLIFVGLQVKSNTVATQAATLQESISFDVQILTAAGASAEAACALWEYSFRTDRVSGEQRIQGRWLFASTVGHWENIYLQHLAGTLSADAWRAREPALRALMLSSGWEEFIGSEFGSMMGGGFLIIDVSPRCAQRWRCRG